MKVYLVWNNGMNECVGFTDKKDAIHASTGRKQGFMSSSLAVDFRENYGDDSDEPMPMTEIDIVDAKK